MPDRFVMPRGASAVRRAALAELRATLAAIRSASRLLGSACRSPTARPFVTTIARATARADRAVALLERLLKRQAVRK